MLAPLMMKSSIGRAIGATFCVLFFSLAFTDVASAQGDAGAPAPPAPGEGGDGEENVDEEAGNATVGDNASMCSFGVRPGEHYAEPSQVWMRSSSKDNCEVGDLLPFAYGDEQSSNDMECLIPEGETQHQQCRILDRGGGGYWCPLKMKEKSKECVIKEGTDGCFEDGSCVEEYGICRCVQCPCDQSYKSGRECNLCKPRGCDDECQRNKMLRPGINAWCRFNSGFYMGGLSQVFEPNLMAQPRTEFFIFRNDADILSVSLSLYYNMCMEQQALMVTVNFTDCVVGTLTECKSRDIPTPCTRCPIGDSLYIPEESIVIGTYLENFFKATAEEGIIFGCQYEDCKYFLESLVIDLGPANCTFGAQCMGNSSEGEELGWVEYVTDAQADKAYILWLGIFMVGTLSLAAGVVLAAALYEFKPQPQPSVLRPATIGWKNVKFGGIVEDMEGEVAPGQFVAILGTVGAGKSTLLKMLAGREAASNGNITLNDIEVNMEDLGRAVGFVPQDVTCCDLDTVGEAVAFSAKLCGGPFPELGPLAEKIDARINTLSGGQKRLVDIFVELARRPYVLLLDEPTSGLDAKSSLEITQVLKGISKQIPVICTIHQPRPEIAEYFTDLLVIHEGKAVCAVGKSTGDSSAAEGLAKLLEKHQALNPNGKDAIKTHDTFDQVMDLAYAGEVLSTAGLGAPAQMMKGTCTQTDKTMHLLVRELPKVPNQFIFLSIRNTKRSLRRPFWKYFITFVLSMWIGYSYYELGKEAEGLRDRFSVLFLVNAYLALQGVSATSEYAETADLVEHEIQSYVYTRPVDAALKVTGQIVGQLPHAALLSCILYPAVGFRTDDGRPFIFGLCIMCVAITSAMTALVGRGLTPNRGVLGAALLNGCMAFFCGAFTDTPNLKGPIRWLQDISTFRMSFEVTLAYEFIGLQTTIKIKGTEQLLEATGEYYLKALSLPTKFNDELFQKFDLVVVLTFFWIMMAFILMALPTMRRRFFPKRRRNQEDVSLAPLQTAIRTASLRDPSFALLMQKAGDTMQDDLCTELTWSRLGNPDTMHLSGGVRTGQVLGIMGPCGSGKTTLLRMLSGRIKPDVGKIRINGIVMESTELQSFVGYVPQEEWVCREDTVGDALEFAAIFARPSLGNSIDTAPLNPKAFSHQFGQLSQGQRRIAGVCAELARQPLALAMDEPTTGLDTASSVRLVSMIKEFSQNQPVLMTLHTPRPEIQAMLTHVLLMDKGKPALYMPYERLRRLMEPGVQRQIEVKWISCKDLAAARDTDSGFAGAPKVAPKAEQSVLNSSAVDTAIGRIDRCKGMEYIQRFAADDTLLLSVFHRQGLSLSLKLKCIFMRSFKRRWLTRPFKTAALVLVWWFSAIFIGSAMADQFPLTSEGVIARMGFFFGLNMLIGILTIPLMTDYTRNYAPLMHELQSGVMSCKLAIFVETMMLSLERLVLSLILGSFLLALLPLNPAVGHRFRFLLILWMTSIVVGQIALLCSVTFKPAGAANIFNGFLVFMLITGSAYMSTNPEEGAAAADPWDDTVEKFSVLSHAFKAQMENELVGLTGIKKMMGTVVMDTETGEQWMKSLRINHFLGPNMAILFAWGVAVYWLSVFCLSRNLKARRRAQIG